MLRMTCAGLGAPGSRFIGPIIWLVIATLIDKAGELKRRHRCAVNRKIRQFDVHAGALVVKRKPSGV